MLIAGAVVQIPASSGFFLFSSPALLIAWWTRCRWGRAYSSDLASRRYSLLPSSCFLIFCPDLFSSTFYLSRDCSTKSREKSQRWGVFLFQRWLRLLRKVFDPSFLLLRFSFSFSFSPLSLWPWELQEERYHTTHTFRFLFSFLHSLLDNGYIIPLWHQQQQSYQTSHIFFFKVFKKRMIFFFSLG